MLGDALARGRNPALMLPHFHFKYKKVAIVSLVLKDASLQ